MAGVQLENEKTIKSKPRCPDVRTEAGGWRAKEEREREDDRMCSSKESRSDHMHTHTLPGKCSPEQSVLEDKVSEIQEQLK